MHAWFMLIATPETETEKPSAGLLVAGRSLQSFVATTVTESSGWPPKIARPSDQLMLKARPGINKLGRPRHKTG
jgi:hypothetical protein